MNSRVWGWRYFPWVVLSVLVCDCLVVEAVMGGEPADPPEPDAAVVFVQRNGFGATIEGLKKQLYDHSYYTFLGIRYAQPPKDQKRFQRPVKLELTGKISANKSCEPCPQLRDNKVVGSEDCLCLSIYAPKMPAEKRGSPVIVFIHGGNYRTGSTHAYGGQHLTMEDTILVNVQYRLGSLGFLSSGTKNAAGNIGLFDMMAAMDWVHSYIEFFGGDPSRVLVMGQGSGAKAASLLTLSGRGRSAGGVVALSGAPLSPNTVSTESKDHLQQLATLTDCRSNHVENLINCLRKLPFEDIIKADSKISSKMVDTDKFIKELTGYSVVGARVEGQYDERGLPPLVSEAPSASLSKARRSKRLCPMLTGVNSAETSGLVFGEYADFLTDKLNIMKDFIQRELVGGLRTAIGNVKGLLPLQNITKANPLDNYYQLIFENSLQTVDGLKNIAEATADALFNFPAYQSVKAWSTSAPAYLYRFEHAGNLTKGSHFLPGVALAGMSQRKVVKEGPAHGDELAYIFEALDERGNSVMATDISMSDAKVRSSFLKLISKFAHNLQQGESAKDLKFLPFQPFSGAEDKYLKIGETISLDKNFRFCEMGLWGNIDNRLTETICKDKFDILSNLKPPSLSKVLEKPPIPKFPIAWKL